MSGGKYKVSPGTKGTPDLGKEWMAAGVNFPIEEGASLATEEGRAEVEFENGTMAYLAEHSVLQFKKLTSNSQGTNTKVMLLTGRATFALESNGHDDFTLRTGVASMHMNQARTLRVESALNGALIHVVEGSFTLNEGAPGKSFAVGPGDAFECVGEGVRRVENPQDDAGQKAWDYGLAQLPRQSA